MQDLGIRVEVCKASGVGPRVDVRHRVNPKPSTLNYAMFIRLRV